MLQGPNEARQWELAGTREGLGNSACRASAANSGERIRSVSWENRVLRVDPYFLAMVICLAKRNMKYI